VNHPLVRVPLTIAAIILIAAYERWRAWKNQKA
jgi:hypothetical protein